jgi:hypothetical protein
MASKNQNGAYLRFTLYVLFSEIENLLLHLGQIVLLLIAIFEVTPVYLMILE